jgi:hypothetical protein
MEELGILLVGEVFERDSDELANLVADEMMESIQAGLIGWAERVRGSTSR